MCLCVLPVSIFFTKPCGQYQFPGGLRHCLKHPGLWISCVDTAVGCEGPQRPALKSHVLASRGLIVLRFAKYALEFFSVNLYRQIFIVFPPFVRCLCVCLKFLPYSLSSNFLSPTLTFLLTSAFKLSSTAAAPSSQDLTAKASCAFIPLCLHYDITCPKWPSSPILVCKICNIF